MPQRRRNSLRKIRQKSQYLACLTAKMCIPQYEIKISKHQKGNAGPSASAVRFFPRNVRDHASFTFFPRNTRQVQKIRKIPTCRNNFCTFQNNFPTCQNNFPTCLNNFRTCFYSILLPTNEFRKKLSKIIFAPPKIIFPLALIIFSWEHYFGRQDNYFGRWGNNFGRWENLNLNAVWSSPGLVISRLSS